MLTFVLIVVIIFSIILKYTILKVEDKYFYYRDIPSNDSPAYIGKIVKGHIDGNDLIATILDLSYRKYIRIEEENIRGKNKKVLYLEKGGNTIELNEYELFILNKIFKNDRKVIFDDYIGSSKFKNDFKTFDDMLERRIRNQTIYKGSIYKNISKIIFLVCFLILGTFMFYSILAPISFGVLNKFNIENNNLIIINGIVSFVIYLLIAYLYIRYIGESTSMRENINLNITYIILSIVLVCGSIIIKYDNIINILKNEIVWYKIIIDFIIGMITLLYMFNIIKHTKKQEFWYIFMIIVGGFSIILNIELTKCICILFITTYIFFKMPKHFKLKNEEYLVKWEGFKKYLEDYSMLSEHEENAILIWEKYLIYAISLGVNKNIINKYGKLGITPLIDEKYLRRFYIEYI